MLPLQIAGMAKTIIEGFYGAYTSARDCEKMGVTLMANYGNYGGGYGIGSDYGGQDIQTVEDAVNYCKSKIHARGTHQKTAAGVSLTISGASAAVGGLGGSIVPGAGTLAGAAVGGAAGFAISTSDRFHCSVIQIGHLCPAANRSRTARS